MTQKEHQRHKAYLEMAQRWAQLSYCRRKKVGALIVKDDMIISDGYNGTPSGFPNECEEADGKTSHWYVLHAEANALTKLSKKGGVGADGATLYLTMSPCKDCCKLIIQNGIKELFYIEEYRNTDGLEILRQAGIQVAKMPINNG